MTLSELFKIAEKAADGNHESAVVDRRESLCYMDVNTPDYRAKAAEIAKQQRR